MDVVFDKIGYRKRVSVDVNEPTVCVRLVRPSLAADSIEPQPDPQPLAVLAEGLSVTETNIAT